MPTADQETNATPQPVAFVANRFPSQAELDITATTNWLPLSQAALSLDDWGTLQGATLVERLRTVNGRALDCQAHLGRLASSAQVLGIEMPKYLTCKLIEQCIARNRLVYPGIDFGIVVLLTPGHTSDRPWDDFQRSLCTQRHLTGRSYRTGISMVSH